MTILVAIKLKLPIVDMDMLLSTIYRVDQVECEKLAPLRTNDHLSIHVYIKCYHIDFQPTYARPAFIDTTVTKAIVYNSSDHDKHCHHIVRFSSIYYDECTESLEMQVDIKYPSICLF